MLQPIRKAVSLGSRVVHSPITRRVIHTGRVVSDIANLVGVPSAGIVSKGLSKAEELLARIQK